MSRATIGVVLAGVLGVACMEPQFPELPDAGPADAGEAGTYAISMTWSPEHAHPGEVLTFVFTITKDGAPVDGLTPTVTFEQTSGGTLSGEIAMSPGTEPGAYTGRRALTTAGIYVCRCVFEHEGVMVDQTMPPLNLEGH